jgi:hypothetical protein
MGKNRQWIIRSDRRNESDNPAFLTNWNSGFSSANELMSPFRHLSVFLIHSACVHSTSDFDKGPIDSFPREILVKFSTLRFQNP